MKLNPFTLIRRSGTSSNKVKTKGFLSKYLISGLINFFFFMVLGNQFSIKNDSKFNTRA